MSTGNVLTIIKKIGDKVLSIVEWPFKHSVMLARLIRDGKKDIPQTRDAIIGLVQRFEALGPELVSAIAARGFDIAEDLKVEADLKSIFVYFKDTLLPVIEQDYADLKADTGAQANLMCTDPASVTPAAPAETQTAVIEVPAIVAGPGLHTVVPA